jgi:hypothetical protein
MLGHMAHDPMWLRESSRLLGNLLQAREDELDDLRRERLDGGERPDAVELGAARAILIHLAEALREPDPARWQGVRHARQMLDDWEHGRNLAPADAPRSAPPPSPVPAAPVPVAAPSPVVTPAPRVAALPVAAASPWAPPAATPAAAGPASDVIPFSGTRQPPPIIGSLEPNALFGQTAPADTRASSKPALPFDAAGRDAPAALDLDRYASFCAENACWPDHRGDIVRRYGLDEAQARELELHYRQALTRDPALDRRFAQLLAGHRRRLQG